VSEVKGNKDIVGVKIRLTGKIASKSLKSYADYYEFKVTDGKEEITVVYKGILPNSFQDGADIIADGYMQEDGKFKAKNLLVKCPSKYVPKERGGEESSVKIWYYVLIGLFLPLGLAIFLIKVITQKKRFFERK
jgi:cytochrome c-type biogenesis protein CcmE